MRRFRKSVALLLACCAVAGVLLASRAVDAAEMSDYCQVPPFVVSNVAPNVMLLLANSVSMLKFAYASNDCCTSTNKCGPYVDNTYYGYFDPGYWYIYQSGRFKPIAAKSATRPKNPTEWDGSFLNWLTMRRIDVLRKVLTGGRYTGQTLNSQIAFTGSISNFKIFADPTNVWTPTSVNAGVNDNVTAEFTTGNASNTPTFTLSWKNSMGVGVTDGPYSVDVDVVTGTTIEGVLQREVGARARLGLTFYKSDNEGGYVNPPIGQTSLSGMISRINTPSNINGGAAQPLAEAIYTITGYYAQVATSSDLGLPASTCLRGTACEPRHQNGDYTISSNMDPFNYSSSGPARYPPCAKSFVLIVSDGEPCGDGQIPKVIVDNTPVAYRYLGPVVNTMCGSIGDNVAGAESVALAAHVADLRTSGPPAVGKNNIDRIQNLNFYVVQAFGSGSGLLKRVAINGGFEDSNNNKVPDVVTEYNTSGVSGAVDTFFEATDGRKLEQALIDAFSGILKRASSGTAASVLASGEGSGANLVQAIFYPRRRFGNDVIMWTGSLQNLWYYVDPYLGNAAIHEDTNPDRILHLDEDRFLRFTYDTGTDTTGIALYDTTATGAIDNTVPAVYKSFEAAAYLWEAGKALYEAQSGPRTIYSMGSDNVVRPFVDTNYSYFQTEMAVPTPPFPYTVGMATQALINYVRGTDCTVLVRRRTVSVQGATSPDNVWKLGDIVHSTPRIAGGVPLNNYYKIYSDPTYKAFTDNAAYQSRGMVFAGGNDGMLHAFKLGSLKFSGSWKTSPAQKAKLFNFGNTSIELGNELWAYIPKNALPYLQYLSDNNYCHLYYADLSPTIVDASIGSGTTDQSDEVRTQGSWRTVLIGGMRTGGACRRSSGTCSSTTGGIPDCVKAPTASGGLSSYFAIDITEADNPRVLWEFADERLGFATTGPSVVRLNGHDSGGNSDRNRNGNWYVVVGSGPTGPVDNTYNQFLGRSDQPLRLFVLDLKTGELEAMIDNTGISNAFAGSMINSSADFDLDYQDDAVFLGYVKKDTATNTWTKGGVGRLVTRGKTDATQWRFSTVLDNIGPVTSAVVRLQNNTYHTNWLYFGEGRYYYERDTEIDDASGQRRIYGIKDPCFKSSNLYGDPLGCTNQASFASLTDQTVIDNSITSGVADAPGFSGWYISLSNDNTTLFDYGDGGHYYHAERVITDPLSAATTGTVYFTAYRPYNEMCNLGGKSFVWAMMYDTGGAPSAAALQGKALIQVSTAAVEQIDLATAFSGANSQGGRRSTAMEGVPPIAQGLSILTPPPPVKKILHMKEH